MHMAGDRSVIYFEKSLNKKDMQHHAIFKQAEIYSNYFRHIPEAMLFWALQKLKKDLSGPGSI